MNVRTHRQANTDLLRLNRLKTSPQCESYAVRLQVSNVLARNCSTVGVQDTPKSFIGSIMWNVEIPYPRLNIQAGETVRHTVGCVGVRCGKKRMSTCNGLNTGSKFARLEREQTSRRCPVTRNLRELHQERKAKDGGHLAGWCTSRRKAL